MKLYNHQIEIIKEDPKQTGLFLGTGSGKTSTALSLAKGRTLVICPKTQKEDDNWGREYDRMALNDLAVPKVLQVVSKEDFRKRWAELPDFDTVIIDEAHTCLGVTPNVRWIKRQPIPKTSQLFQALEEYLNRTKPERLYLCTATIMRSPMTVWGAARLLGKDWNYYEFRDTFYFKLPMPGREVWQVKNDPGTKDRLAVAVRKLGQTGQLSDYFDVPEQSYKTIWLDLTPVQKERIKAVKLEYPDPLVLVGKKHQIENGILAGDEFNCSEQFPNAKRDTIIDLAIEFPKMIVFAKYSQQIRDIEESIKKLGKKVFVLEGATKDRGGMIKEALTTDEYVFIAQAQISAGWELPDCPVMVFASMSYSIVDRIQAEGRILRANKLKKNLYIDLVARGGIDEAVYKSIGQKKDFNERVYCKDNM